MTGAVVVGIIVVSAWYTGAISRAFAKKEAEGSTDSTSTTTSISKFGFNGNGLTSGTVSPWTVTKVLFQAVSKSQKIM